MKEAQDNAKILAGSFPSHIGMASVVNEYKLILILFFVFMIFYVADNKISDFLFPAAEAVEKSLY